MSLNLLSHIIFLLLNSKKYLNYKGHSETAVSKSKKNLKSTSKCYHLLDNKIHNNYCILIFLITINELGISLYSRHDIKILKLGNSPNNLIFSCFFFQSILFSPKKKENENILPNLPGITLWV